MKKLILMLAAVMLTVFGFAAAIENVIALQRPGTGIVDIYYDLIINEGGTTTVSASVEGGDSEVRMETLSGDIGHVVPGPARHIVWNAQADNPERVISNLKVVISAAKMDTIVDHGMRWIPEGACDYMLKGLSYYDGIRCTQGGGFYIDRVPVSGAMWHKVYQWATQHGIKLNSSGYSSSSDVIYFKQYDVNPWINARNRMEGLPYDFDYDIWGDSFRINKYNYKVPRPEEVAYIIYKGISGDLRQAYASNFSRNYCNGYVMLPRNSNTNPVEFKFGDPNDDALCAHPLFCVRYKSDDEPIQETFPPNYSSPFTIDTRLNSPDFPKDFKILDVKSNYCDGEYGAGNKALFLSGVSCNVEFEADVFGGELAYLERVDNEDVPAVGEQISEDDGKFSLDVGAFAPGDLFVVRACSVDGRYSKTFRLNFDIASQKGWTWKAVPGKNSVQYRTLELDSFRLFDQLGEDQPDLLSAQKSNFIKDVVNNFKDYPHELSIGVNLCWTMDSSDGIIHGVALFGAQTSAEVDKILDRRVKNASKALKFKSVSGELKIGVEQTWLWDKLSRDWQEQGNDFFFDAGASGCFAAGWRYGFYYTADGGLDLHLRTPLLNGGLQYLVDTDDLLYATLRAGLGIPSAVSIIEGAGTGRLFMTYDTKTEPQLQRLGVALDLVFHSYAFGLVFTIWDWSGSLYWIGGESDPIDFDINMLVDRAMSNAVTNSDNYLSREYTNNCNTTSGSSGGGKYAGYQDTVTNLYPTSYSPVIIAKDGMPGPNPQPPQDTPPTNAGGGTSGGSGNGPNDTSPPRRPPRIVTVADDTSRSTRRRATIITISDNTNTTFTTEGAVWDDGTPDYCPTIARMTNGCDVVAWMNEQEGRSEDISLGEMMSAMEIAIAVWNDATGEWSHLNLTDNSAYDRSPVLKTATNGTAAVAWLRNVHTNYIGSAAEPNQVCFARYADGTWTTETVVVPAVGRVRKLDMAYDGNRAAIVFNEEDDPGNGTTQRLCVVTGDGTAWSPCRVAAESQINGSAAYAYYDEIGNLRLVWNDEGGIKTGIYSEGSLIVETIDTDGRQIPSDYIFTRAHSGRMALVWLEPIKDGETAMGPVSMTYNPAHGVWSLPCALTSDGKNKTEVSAAFNDKGDLEVLYATPNTETNAQGIAETVSSGFSKVTRWHGGDVAILAEDISFSTNVFVAGETMEVSFKVKNLGDEPVSNIIIRIQDQSDGMQYLTNRVCVSGLQDGQTLTSTRLYDRIDELKCRQCLEIRATWTIPKSVSSQLYLYFRASGAGDVMSRNDYVNWRYGSSNVVLVQPKSSKDENRRYVRHVSIALDNAGLAGVPAGTTVTFRRGDSNGTVLAEKTVGKVLAGDDGIQNTGFSWDISTIVPTSDVEVVHVTAVLPESAGVEQRTLESDILVDVAPVVKSPLTAYTLTYDANGGDGTMASENPFYDEWEPLASNAFTRTGHQFEGWALSPTGEVVYADGVSHWNIPMYSRNMATLYAIWTRLAEETTTTDVPIPYSWIGTYFPEATNSTEDMSTHMANFEMIANRLTGKYDGGGNAMSVWHDYVAGTDPTNLNSVFTAAIEIVNGAPHVTWSPNLNLNGIERIYTIWGKTNLTDDVGWMSPTNSGHRFFKVEVKMP